VLGQHLTLTRPLAILDIETTGSDIAKARVMQFGMELHYPNTTEVKTYKTLVNPNGEPVHPKAMEAHGITPFIIEHGCAKCWETRESHPHETCEKFWPVPTFADIAGRLHSGLVGCDFGGYHLRAFDLPVLEAEFSRVGLVFDWRSAYILDALRLWQIMESRTLTDAVARFAGRELQDAHDALADVIGTRDALIGQLATWPGLPRDLRALHDLQWPKNPDAIDNEGKFVFIDGVACMNFGKHKGEPMHACIGYLQWMLTKDFSPEIKHLCQNAVDGTFPTRGTLPFG